ncbi:MAG TPA: hypothetical protein VN947_28085 [Polyangia bacterium]|nr:hypothetical protein [Polyangia bacterium]
MRTLLACAAVASLFVAAGGCLGDGGTVTLTFDQQMSVTPTVVGFNASNATGTAETDGFVHFTATSAMGTLTMLTISPIHAGDMVDLMQEHNFVSFDISGAGWGSNGGMLAVDEVSPYKVRFLAVPMIRGSGSAMGSFVINGSGTFK